MSVIFQNLIIFDGYEVFKGSVSFSSEKIDKIVKSPAVIQELPGDEVVSGNYILMPGMVNLHAHAAMTLFKSAGEDLPLDKRLNERIFPLESKFVTSEMVYYASLWSMIESLRSGVTTLNDMYFFEEDVARAAKDINMKVFIGECAFDFKGPSNKDAGQILDELESLIRKYKDDNLVYVAGTPHSPYLTDEKYLLKYKGISDKYQIPYHIHMSETKKEVLDYEDKFGKTEFERFDELGLLGERFIGAHCVHLTDNDLNILSKNRVTIAHCPSSNMKLGSGVARIVDMIDKRINVAIATDGSASGNNLNLVQEAELATKLQKGILQNSGAFKAIDALRAITSNAGKPLGGNFGTICVGAPADLVLMDYSSPELYPVYDICAAILYGSSTVDIKSVYVNGKKVVENGNILTMDIEKVKTNFISFVNEVTSYLDN